MSGFSSQGAGAVASATRLFQHAQCVTVKNVLREFVIATPIPHPHSKARPIPKPLRGRLLEQIRTCRGVIRPWFSAVSRRPMTL